MSFSYVADTKNIYIYQFVTVSNNRCTVLKPSELAYVGSMLRHPRHITYRKVGSMILLHSKISNLEGSTEYILSRKCQCPFTI